MILFLKLQGVFCKLHAPPQKNQIGLFAAGLLMAFLPIYKCVQHSLNIFNHHIFYPLNLSLQKLVCKLWKTFTKSHYLLDLFFQQIILTLKFKYNEA